MSSWTSYIFGNKKHANQRKEPRHPVLLEVGLNSRSVSNAAARITDLSISGCYITTLLPVIDGEKMQLNIGLPTGKNFSVNGVVVFRDPHIGFGVEFDLTDRQTEFMRDLIEYARQDS